jgi:hypothetical protein
MTQAIVIIIVIIVVIIVVRRGIGQVGTVAWDVIYINRFVVEYDYIVSRVHVGQMDWSVVIKNEASNVSPSFKPKQFGDVIHLILYEQHALKTVYSLPPRS